MAAKWALCSRRGSPQKGGTVPVGEFFQDFWWNREGGVPSDAAADAGGYSHKRMSKVKAGLGAKGVAHAADFPTDGTELSGGGGAWG